MEVGRGQKTCLKWNAFKQDQQKSKFKVNLYLGAFQVREITSSRSPLFQKMDGKSMMRLLFAGRIPSQQLPDRIEKKSCQGDSHEASLNLHYLPIVSGLL